MIRSGAFSYAGRRHGFVPENRTDAVLERDCGGHRAVVLCSGGDSCPCGKAAAELTAQAAASFLAFRFARCLLEEPEVLRRELVQVVTRVLGDAARRAGRVPSQFGCTLLAAAMDQRGRFCAFHLGDGTLLGKLEMENQWTVFSQPHSGLTPGSTALTMNGSMFPNLRFYRTTQPGGHRLFLTGDGIAGLVPRLPQLLDHPDRLEGLIRRGEQGQLQDLPELSSVLEDDCSAAWLSAFPWL